MKIFSMKMMMCVGVGLVGYYLLRNSSKIKELGMNTNHEMYSMFEEEDM